MAKYTISISDKIQETAVGSMFDYNVLLTASKAALFGPELEQISSAYRDPFALGFALHFFNDEIGLETWPLWRFGLMEKIYNNKEFINQTYALLDKQIFANYKINTVTNITTKVDNTVTATNQAIVGTEGHTDLDVLSKNDVTDLTNNNTNTIDLTNNSDTLNNSTNISNGEHITDALGNAVNSNKSTGDAAGTSSHSSDDLSDSNSVTGTIGNVNSDSTNSGTDTNKESSTGSTVNVSATESSNTDNTTDEALTLNKQVNKMSDTPQQGLSGLEAGTYLTQATISDLDGDTNNTGIKAGNSLTDTDSSSTVGNESESSMVHGLKNITNTDNTSDTSTANSTSSSNAALDLNSSVINSSDDGEAAKVDNSNIIDSLISSESGNVGNVTTNQGTTTDAGSNKVTLVGSETSNKSGDINTDNSTVGSSNVDNTGTINTVMTDETYDWNYEMLMKSESVLNRVWTLFDDLFLGIYF